MGSAAGEKGERPYDDFAVTHGAPTRLPQADRVESSTSGGGRPQMIALSTFSGVGAWVAPAASGLLGPLGV